jgi:hypothetical protein
LGDELDPAVLEEPKRGNGKSFQASDGRVAAAGQIADQQGQIFSSP